MINPGRLNKKIKIYKQTNSHDDYGEPIDDKDLIHECWASVRNKSGKEQFETVTPYAKTITSFLIRYTKKNIDTTMTIEFCKRDIKSDRRKQDSTYNIVYVDNYNFSNEWIEITAERVE